MLQRKLAERELRITPQPGLPEVTRSTWQNAQKETSSVSIDGPADRAGASIESCALAGWNDRAASGRMG